VGVQEAPRGTLILIVTPEMKAGERVTELKAAVMEALCFTLLRRRSEH